MKLGVTWAFVANAYHLFVQEKQWAGVVGAALDLAKLGKEAEECCINAIDKKLKPAERDAAMKRLKEIAAEQDKQNGRKAG